MASSREVAFLARWSPSSSRLRERVAARAAASAARTTAAPAEGPCRVEGVRSALGEAAPRDFGDDAWEWIRVPTGEEVPFSWPRGLESADGKPRLLARSPRHMDALLSGQVAPTAGAVWPASVELCDALARGLGGFLGGRRVVEVGAGSTGLPGLVCAGRGATRVTLTDFERCAVHVLAANAKLAAPTTVDAVRLDWAVAAPSFFDGVDLILVSDCVHAGEGASEALARLLGAVVLARRGGTNAVRVVCCWERRALHARSEAAFFHTFAAATAAAGSSSCYFFRDAAAKYSTDPTRFGLRLAASDDPIEQAEPAALPGGRRLVDFDRNVDFDAAARALAKGRHFVLDGVLSLENPTLAARVAAEAAALAPPYEFIKGSAPPHDADDAAKFLAPGGTGDGFGNHRDDVVRDVPTLDGSAISHLCADIQTHFARGLADALRRYFLDRRQTGPCGHNDRSDDGSDGGSDEAPVPSLQSDATLRAALRGLHARERPQLALYPGSGAKYDAHVDDGPGGGLGRLVTVVYYPSPWLPGDGGALRVFADASRQTFVDVAPLADRLVCFDSTLVHHAVRPSRGDRRSVTIWLSDPEATLPGDRRRRGLPDPPNNNPGSASFAGPPTPAKERFPANPRNRPPPQRDPSD